MTKAELLKYLEPIDDDAKLYCNGIDNNGHVIIVDDFRIEPSLSDDALASALFNMADDAFLFKDACILAQAALAIERKEKNND